MQTGRMFKTGLVSVTFRKLKAAEIVNLAAQAKISGIEWGGDIHVPHGDLKQASEVAAMTRDAGLEVACYGSYYRLGAEPGKSPPFSTVIEAAMALQAPSIRVWPGTRASAKADSGYRRAVAEEAFELAEILHPHGIKLAYEFHANTLTDCPDSAVALLNDTRHPAVYTLWQAASDATPEENLQGLQRIRDRLLNIHVFHWQTENKHRIKCPLAEGTQVWQPYLREAGALSGEGWCLLEFVRDDSPEQFLQDAATLNSWLQK